MAEPDFVRGSSLDLDDRPVLLLTCSGISHTGQLTTMAGNSLRCRHPVLVSRHVRLTSLTRSLEKELTGDECLIAVDGCEECCAKKRMDLIGKIPDAYLIATREGITKRGMEEPRYDEIECLCQAVVRTIRKSGGKNDE
ncbi:MAG TPA: putative zinc-binding protein [Methanoregulaceae archaeon]|nr:putative zinc-binding protein [Methanolinea sp.]HNY89852.1 putative zinc-binding protein [Methanoregulaceae archaeon]HOB58865.1 putative zinc-binding protein [Methanoregulaceae archaeon]HOW33403.1 putative zinc-binding protein [Methanoregulaceae archaeon]HPW10314.1 putative zinc-binding protein [Methanoregulaceae archaeon]